MKELLVSDIIWVREASCPYLGLLNQLLLMTLPSHLLFPRLSGSLSLGATVQGPQGHHRQVPRFSSLSWASLSVGNSKSKGVVPCSLPFT